MLKLHNEADRGPFQVGPRRYTVRVTRDRIFYEDEECLGICHPGTLEIQISPFLPKVRRLEVLIHELTHAFVFAFGQPRDVEALCDFVASVGELVLRDLAACGGVEALLDLRPGDELCRLDAAETSAA
jgi:hypothetical protein